MVPVVHSLRKSFEMRKFVNPLFVFFYLISEPDSEEQPTTRHHHFDKVFFNFKAKPKHGSKEEKKTKKFFKKDVRIERGYR